MLQFDASKLVINLEAMRQRIATRGKRSAVRAGGKVMAAAMTEATPVQAGRTLGSDSLEVGEMKANIKVRTKDEDGEPVALVGPAGKGGRVPKAAYLVEYGHRMVTGGKSKLNADGSRGGGGKVSTKDVPAHPFLRPAFHSSSAASIEAMAESLGGTIKEGGKS